VTNIPDVGMWKEGLHLGRADLNPVEGLIRLQACPGFCGTKIGQLDFVNSKSYLYPVLFTALESKNAKQRGIVDKSRGGRSRLTLKTIMLVRRLVIDFETYHFESNEELIRGPL